MHAPLPPNGSETRAPDRKQRRGRGRRAIKIAVVVFTALLGISVGGLYVATEHLASQVHRYPNVFSGLDPAARPPAAGALTFLLVGSDSLHPGSTNGSDAIVPDDVPGVQRSDAIMLIHVNADYSGATIVSLPRDSWVALPNRGMNKINAAYSLGGPNLLVQTVERLTQLRVDHFAVIDFSGFQSLTDAVGGIDVNVATPTTMGDVSFHSGQNHLNGKESLAYVRQRKGLPAGDLDRVQRHQNALRALMIKVLSSGRLSSPTQAYDLLGTLTRWISVDDTLRNSDLRSLAWDLRHLRPTHMTFLTAPVAKLGREGPQSVVYLDAGRGSQLWQAIKAGEIESYKQTYPTSTLSDSPP